MVKILIGALLVAVALVTTAWALRLRTVDAALAWLWTQENRRASSSGILTRAKTWGIVFGLFFYDYILYFVGILLAVTAYSAFIGWMCAGLVLHAAGLGAVLVGVGYLIFCGYHSFFYARENFWQQIPSDERGPHESRRT